MPAVLLCGSGDRARLLDIGDLGRCTSVTDLKEELGLPRSTQLQVSFKDKPLSNPTLPYTAEPAPTEALTVQAAQGNAFTNGWFLAAPTRAYAKVLDLSWSPMRQADYLTGFWWLGALLVCLFISSEVLAALQ